MQDPGPPAHSPEALLACLENAGITVKTTSHAAVFTVEESRALRGVIDGAHTKNLFLKDKKDKLFLVTALESARINLKTLHLLIGATGRLSFANAELLMRHWGVEPGSVTPFGAINDREGKVTVILDQAMMRLELLNFHPLTNTMSTAIRSADLLRFLGSTGHQPRVIAASEADPANNTASCGC